MRARDNPFRTESILRVRYRLPGTEWEQLLRRCERLQYRAALVGPCGSGKTTLLEDLEPKFQDKGFETVRIRLNQQRSYREQWSVPRVSSRHIILFDGAEQLSWVAWQWFKWRTRRAAGLIITTHRPGRLPTLWECLTTSHMLSAIIAEVLAGSRLPAPADPSELFWKHEGNLRDALRECYDLVARSEPRSASIPVLRDLVLTQTPTPLLSIYADSQSASDSS